MNNTDKLIIFEPSYYIARYVDETDGAYLMRCIEHHLRINNISVFILLANQYKYYVEGAPLLSTEFPFIEEYYQVQKPLHKEYRISYKLFTNGLKWMRQEKKRASSVPIKIITGDIKYDNTQTDSWEDVRLDFQNDNHDMMTTDASDYQSDPIMIESPLLTNFVKEWMHGDTSYMM
jgi:hypothetical protein